MLNSNSRTSKTIKILGAVCLVIAGCLTIFNIINSFSDVVSLTAQILCLFALVFAAFYLWRGCTKDSAKYYKNFGIVLLASQAMIVPISCSRDTTFVFILSLVMLVALFVLVLGENLGKTVSLTLCAVLVLCNIVSLFVTNDGIIPVLGMITKIVTYSVYGIFTYAKYADKAARGSR